MYCIERLLPLTLLFLLATPLATLCQADPFFLSMGKFHYNARIRYEHADQERLEKANALTFRQRLGFETVRWSGLHALIEGEHTWVLNNGAFAPYPPPFNEGRTVVADPESLILNQAYLGLTREAVSGALGRQALNLGNQRFVGSVGWRQNDQTYDLFRMKIHPFPEWNLDYAWNWQVNRIFGTKAPREGLRRFKADNHFLNVAYNGLPRSAVGAYYYRLQLRNARALSSDTYGFFLDGNHPLTDDRKVLYRLELAQQISNGMTTGVDYEAMYYRLLVGLDVGAHQAGFNFESLGSDKGRSFQTPLATLHAFNRWADAFLSTPPEGLRDYSLWYTGSIMNGINVRLEGHLYTAETSGHRYGEEYGVSLTRRLGKHVTVMLKGSYLNGRSLADLTKVWLQIDYKL